MKRRFQGPASTDVVRGGCVISWAISWKLLTVGPEYDITMYFMASRATARHPISAACAAGRSRNHTIKGAWPGTTDARLVWLRGRATRLHILTCWRFQRAASETIEPDRTTHGTMHH